MFTNNDDTQNVYVSRLPQGIPLTPHNLIPPPSKERIICQCDMVIENEMLRDFS